MIDLLDQLNLSTDTFAGRVAVVTGGARGIGEQVSWALAHLGAHVIILDKRDRGEDVAAKIRGNARSAEFIKVDLTDMDRLDSVARGILENHGSADILVNNASKFELDRFGNFPIEVWEELHRTTVRASAFLISTFLPKMIEQGYGVVCNTMASEGMSYAGPFSAAMVGQRSMILTLAGELGSERGVSVMGFAPGATDTPLFREMADKFEELHGIPLDEWADKILRNPGYEGFMPPEHTGASYAYCLVHACEYHGQIADAFEPLIRHGIIDPSRTDADGPEAAGHDAFSLIEDVSEFVTKMSSINRNLEQRIEARTQELSVANERLAEQKQLIEEVSSKIAKCLPRQIYESIFSGEIDAEIDARRRFLTIFFSDISNFTTRTERLEPEALTEILNSYFAAMTEIARMHGATIDKFIGDAVLAFFGDPDSQGRERDAERCILMAIEMQQRMGGLREAHAKLGLHEPLQIRMGINSGYCTVGNFGGFDRMAYTIIGGPVNIAARLQDAAEPEQILIAQNTYALVADKFQLTSVGALELKGVAEKIEAYRVAFDGSDDVRTASSDAELQAMKERLGQIDIETLGDAQKTELLHIMSRLLRR